MIRCLVFLALLCIQSTVSVIVDTPSGSIRGAVSPVTSRVTRFLGVPYADPAPRFQQASIVTPWNGTRNYTEFGPSCHQTLGYIPDHAQSEDCLLMDIYTPADFSVSKSSPLPRDKAVMVFIHGGGFIGGSSRYYEASDLSDIGDVVVVSIQYRLNVYGFLYADGLAPKNLGLWDQKLALEWISQNIGYFGGDTSRITLFGESAGSISIACHMLSPYVNNTLFQRVIMQSGAYVNDKTATTKDDALARIAKAVSCPTGESRERNFECLKSIDTNRIFNPINKLIAEQFPFWPVVDGDYLPNDPLTSLAKYKSGDTDELERLTGNMNQYDTMMGFNGQDGLVMVNYAGLTPEQWKDGVTKDNLKKSARIQKFSLLSSNVEYTNKLADMMAEYYDRQDVDVNGNFDEKQKRLLKMIQMLGDYELSVPTLLTSRVHAAVSTNERASYFYIFDYKSSVGSPIDPVQAGWTKMSANHADELAYMFDLLYPGFYLNRSNLTESERQLRRDMISYWSSFAKTGVPTISSSSTRQADTWQKMTESDMNFLRITGNRDLSEKDLWKDQSDFLLCLWVAFKEGNTDPKCMATSAASHFHLASGLLLSVLIYSFQL